MKKMITPTDLQMSLEAMDASGHYDWKRQAYQLDNCKWGTNQTTTISTNRSTSGGYISDTNFDSYTD